MPRYEEISIPMSELNLKDYDPEGQQYLVELEFLFSSPEEEKAIEWDVEQVLNDFPGTKIIDGEVRREPDGGGVAFYAIYPRVPGLVQELEWWLQGLDFELTVQKTRGGY
jgi:hypothetical protein